MGLEPASASYDGGGGNSRRSIGPLLHAVGQGRTRTSPLDEETRKGVERAASRRGPVTAFLDSNVLIRQGLTGDPPSASPATCGSEDLRRLVTWSRLSWTLAVAAIPHPRRGRSPHVLESFYGSVPDAPNSPPFGGTQVAEQHVRSGANLRPSRRFAEGACHPEHRPGDVRDARPSRPQESAGFLRTSRTCGSLCHEAPVSTTSCLDVRQGDDLGSSLVASHTPGCFLSERPPGFVVPHVRGASLLGRRRHSLRLRWSASESTQPRRLDGLVVAGNLQRPTPSSWLEA